jgi:ATP-dependent Zn protease
MSQLRKTAYHEAGHAVAHYFLRLPFKSVTIKPSAEYKGRIVGGKIPKSFRPDTTWDYRTERRLEREMIALLAGLAAVKRLTGRNSWRGGGKDVSSAIDLAMYVGGDSDGVSAYLSWMIQRARGFMRNPLHWHCVEVLAKELIKRRTIKAREARNIIRRASEPIIAFPKA